MDAMVWPVGPAGLEPAGGRVGATLCGWAIEQALGGGPVCASFVGARGGERAVLRVLREPFASDPEARGDWLRASWAANRFHHARVVKVLEQGTDERGMPVLVRAWARAESLVDAVRARTVDTAAALRLTEQLLDALETAHAHGIVHGALGPTNVLVTPRGTVRVVDFATCPGLVVRRSDASKLLATARRGPFLAPERRGSAPGPATELADVWGAGACLYFALTGEAPGFDVTAAEVAARAGVGQELAAVVALATAAEPARRYESAYAMLGDVRRVMAGQRPRLDGILAPVPSQRAPALPASSSGLLGLGAAETPSVPPSARGEWLGNLLLVVAIALLVGVATFVLVRERMADGPQDAPQSSSQTR